MQFDKRVNMMGTVFTDMKTKIVNHSMTQIQGELTRPNGVPLIKELAEFAIKFETWAFKGGEHYWHMY